MRWFAKVSNSFPLFLFFLFYFSIFLSQIKTSFMQKKFVGKNRWMMRGGKKFRIFILLPHRNISSSVIKVWRGKLTEKYSYEWEFFFLFHAWKLLFGIAIDDGSFCCRWQLWKSEKKAIESWKFHWWENWAISHGRSEFFTLASFNCYHKQQRLRSEGKRKRERWDVQESCIIMFIDYLRKVFHVHVRICSNINF